MDEGGETGGYLIFQDVMAWVRLTAGEMVRSGRALDIPGPNKTC